MEIGESGGLEAAPALLAELETDLARLEEALVGFRAELGGSGGAA